MTVNSKYNIGDIVYLTKEGVSKSIPTDRKCPCCNGSGKESMFVNPNGKKTCDFIRSSTSNYAWYYVKCNQGMLEYTYPTCEVFESKVLGIDIYIGEEGVNEVEYLCQGYMSEQKESSLFASREEALAAANRQSSLNRATLAGIIA